MRLAWIFLLAGCYDFGSLGKSPCTDPGVVCDDFEAGFNSMNWTTNNTLGSGITVDGTHARGNLAMHAHVSKVLPVLAPAVRAQVATRAAVPATPDVFLRFWVYVASPAPTGGVRLATYTQNVPMGLNVGININDRLLGVADDVTQPTTPPPVVSTTALPADSWHCLIFHVGPQSMEGFLDGNRPADLTTSVNITANPPLDHAVFGISYQSRTMNADTDIWFDDIVIDANDPGCGP